MTQEYVLRDYEDVKRYWTEKLCNKVKKLTGNPSNLVRDLSLWYKMIHQKILTKLSSVVMVMTSYNEDFNLPFKGEYEDKVLDKDNL